LNASKLSLSKFFDSPSSHDFPKAPVTRLRLSLVPRWRPSLLVLPEVSQHVISWSETQTFCPLSFPFFQAASPPPPHTCRLSDFFLVMPVPFSLLGRAFGRVFTPCPPLIRRAATTTPWMQWLFSNGEIDFPPFSTSSTFASFRDSHPYPELSRNIRFSPPSASEFYVHYSLLKKIRQWPFLSLVFDSFSMVATRLALVAHARL